MPLGSIRRFVPSPRFALIPLAALTLGSGFLVPSVKAAPAPAASLSVAVAPLESPDLSVVAQCRVTRQDLDGDCIRNNRDRDVDGDGIPNRRDRDIDGDGILNRRDRDMDGDGRPNSRDPDRDGDGRPNRRDNTPNGRR
jgi:hypothetical protein